MPSEVPRDVLNGWNVLVIDDDPKSLEVAKIILAAHGATVHTATNGSEGLQITHEIHPRFVICDLSMPVMDGWGYIEAVVRDRTITNIPVIALTAHAMVGDREKAIAAGFHNYLTKPLTPATFMGELLALLEDIPVIADDLGLV